MVENGSIAAGATIPGPPAASLGMRIIYIMLNKRYDQASAGIARSPAALFTQGRSARLVIRVFRYPTRALEGCLRIVSRRRAGRTLGNTGLQHAGRHLG